MIRLIARAGIVLLVAFAGWVPIHAAERTLDAERTVELVLAKSEHQAQVVARAMRTGFFIDQLLIPETSYVGRFGWSELNPSLKTVLEDAQPGEPELLTGGGGQYLVARLLPTGPPALLGETAYAEDSEAIWAKLSLGPTDPKLLSLEIDVDTEDLAAICASKTRLIDDRLQAARAQVVALAPGAHPSDVIPAYAELTSVLSLKGEMAEAIKAVDSLVQRLPTEAPAGQKSYRDIMHQVLGILELRRGEVDNCFHSPGQTQHPHPAAGQTQHPHRHREMCLFPLSEAAQHRVGDGAQRAVEHFTRYLNRHPTDLEVRWLLNVAAMTIGTYPDGVAERFRIGPDSFTSAADPGRFWDVAGTAGVATSDNAGGSVTDDFDDDGLLDVVLSSRDPCEPLRLYRNSGDGTFSEVTEAAGLGDQLGGLNVTQVDYDNDGRLDLYVMRGGWETAIRDSLLRNQPTVNGGVRFEDVTTQAGLGGPAHRTQTAAWADYDGDGWLDLFVGHEMSFSQLFRSRGDGTFEDVTTQAGLRFRSLTKGATWGDINNDGRPDLYVSNFGDRNLLFVNRGDGRFDEVARAHGVSKPTYSFATWFWDYDNDGWQDLVVFTFLQTVDEVAREYLGQTPQGETLRIYRNRGDGTFEDATTALGMARMIPTMGANFGDLDNDGYLDLYLGTGAPSYGMVVPNRMFLNQQGQKFVDVTTATGTGHLQKGHGVSFADLDNDGDQDILANMGGAFLGDKYPSALFQNPGHGNDWITIELVGKQNNRSAIGARIRVVLDEDGRQTQRVRWVTSGGSFGASPLRQHIGLGRNTKILTIEIAWPVGRNNTLPDVESQAVKPPTHRRQELADVPINSLLVVTEGTPGFELKPQPRFELGAGLAP